MNVVRLLSVISPSLGVDLFRDYDLYRKSPGSEELAWQDLGLPADLRTFQELLRALRGQDEARRGSAEPWHVSPVGLTDHMNTLLAKLDSAPGTRAPELDQLPLIIDSQTLVRIAFVISTQSSEEHQVLAEAVTAYAPLAIRSMQAYYGHPDPWVGQVEFATIEVDGSLQAGAADGPAIAQSLGRRLPGFLQDLGRPGLSVALNALAGSKAALEPMKMVTQALGIPSLIRSGDVVWTEGGSLSVFSPGRFHSNYARVVQVGWRGRHGDPPGGDANRTLYREGLAVLSRTDDQVTQPSEVAGLVFQRTTRQSGEMISSVAKMLYRNGEPSLAGELERLVEHWTQQRIWQVNHVPEMVLHDEVHSQSVDRNVALICEPLLEHKRLSSLDVFRLGLAAWLHDTGHESAIQHGYRETDPQYVRTFHGALTELNLQADQQLAPSTRYELRAEDIPWVRLLSAHHQGRTSCGASPMSAVVPESEQLWRLTAKAPPEHSLDEHALSLGLKVKKEEGDDELARLRLMLAVFRLSDALDVGRHRVPHLSTQREFARQLMADRLGRDRVSFNALVGGHLEPDHPLDMFMETLARINQTSQQPREECDAAVTEFAKSEYATENPYAEALIRSLGTYFIFLIAQADYFEHHAYVAGTYPVLRHQQQPDGASVGSDVTRPSAAEFVLEVLVIPQDGRVTEAIEGVAADYYRELGQRIDNGSLVPDDSFDSKEPIRRALADAGIELHPPKCPPWVFTAESARAAIGRFTVRLLDPSRAASNQDVERALEDGPDRRIVVGFEVTLPAWAKRLDANVDPQHELTEEGTFPVPACVEAVLLPHFDPPPAGAMLVTNRPDPDALAAMVLAAARAAGVDVWTRPMAERVAAIAVADRSKTEPWSPRGHGSQAPSQYASPVSALGAVTMDHHQTLERRIDAVCQFLATGAFDGIEDVLRALRERAEQTRADVEARGGVNVLRNLDGSVEIAVATSTYPTVADLAYEFAPVIVLMNPEMRTTFGQDTYLKYTVARYNSDAATWNPADLAARLNEAEARAGADLGGDGRLANPWGGQRDILGSPQGVSSRLDLTAVVEIVRKAVSGPSVC